MMPQRLLQQFDRISDAPDAIPRLRRFILDLAVRGKLVEQDPNDEPASELLKRIRGVKARHTKKQKDTPEMDVNGATLKVPLNWELVPLIALGTWAIGSGFPKNEQGSQNGQYFFLKVSDMNLPGNEKHIVSSQNFIAEDAAARLGAKIHPRGTIIFPKIGGAIATNKRRILTRGSAIDNNCLGITFWPELPVDWCYLLLKTLDFAQYQAGTAVPALQQGILEQIPVGLPPLAEQQRIVAKVDELMALCDRLEAAQAEHESQRDGLAAAALNRLNNGVDPDAFRDHARFYFNHLPRLTTRVEHVKNLRGTILNLAFRGWLTSPLREPAEIGETAQEFMQSVENARKKSWDSKQVAGSSRKYPSPIDFDRENLPRVPDSWIWASADAVCSQITDGEHIQPRYQAEGLPMLTAKHVREGFVTFEDSKLISDSDFQKCVARCKPEQGDILIVSVGATTGRAAIVSQSRPFALVRSVLLLKPLISPMYFLRWLQSPWCLAWMRQASEASAQPHLYIGDTKRMPVPLPPLAEQQRIVAKVDELMALCDKLETQLTITQTESHRLLEAVLHEALATAV